MTQLANRRHLDEQLVAQVASAQRHGHEVSIALVDVDHFKTINDTYGHSCGDDVLREVARRLRVAARNEDIVGRWGGEEFLVILPFCDADASFQISERLRQVISSEPIVTRDHDVVTVTVSIGCATGTDPDLVERSDLALYAAKDRGRNRTVALPGIPVS